MKKEDIKRFMPVGLLAALASVVIYEAGISFNWWVIKEMAYPLYLAQYLIGLHPVVAMWLLKFTYKKFWLFISVDFIVNLGFVYVFIGWLIAGREIAYVNNNLLLLAIVTALGIALYGYQIWQEGIFYLPYREGEK